MSQQQQKQEGNGEPVFGDENGVSNVEDIHVSLETSSPLCGN